MVARHRKPKWSIPLLLAAAAVCSYAEPPPPTPENPSATESEDMSAQVHVHHAIDYIEIAVTDMAESKRFYRAAFGWEFNDYGPGYAGIRKDGGEAGGFRLEPEVSAGGPLVILYSENLDRTLAGVREAGGEITQAPFEFPGGRRFHFHDPSGNELAVWSPK